MAPIPRLAAALAGALVLALVVTFPTPVSAQSSGDLDAGVTFLPPTIQSGKPTNLRVHLENTNDGTIQSIAFDVVFPAGMHPVGTLDPTQCRGTLTPTSNGVQVRGASLGVFDSCDIVIPVTVDSDTTRDVVQSIGPITSNGGGTVTRIQATLTVVGGIPPKITSPPLPSPAFVGLPYLHQVTVTGTAPVVVTAEGLPPGLSYDDATRRVSGTPTKTGAFLVTLRATNGVVPPDAQVSTVDIINPPLQVATPPPLAPPLFVGAPVSIQLQATGGLPPYRWDLPGGALPPGLTLSEDGRIAGTPTTPGTFGFTVRVRDSLTQFDSRDFQLVVERITTTVKLAIAPNPVVAGQVVTVTATVLAANGLTPAGTLTVWIAGPGTRCPAPFESGADPVTPNVKTATLAGGIAQQQYADLAIGRFRVCAGFEGVPPFAPSTLGPVDLFVIKGIVLPSPKLTLVAPAHARAGGAVSGRVVIEAVGTTARPAGTVRVRAGTRDLGELPIVDGVAAFATTAPDAAGTLAITASYAGDGAFSPAVADPAYVAVLKATLAEAIPALDDLGLALVAMALAGLAAIRLRRRR
ncbi:MAG TPA: putative Ig domain-containing protein [Casimicrobiaceae bacterium]